jgi:hypothetical protein
VLLLENKPDSSAKNIIFGVAFAVTIVMAVYIYWKLAKIKKVLLAEQAERRKARLQQADESEEGQFLMSTGIAPGPQLVGRDYQAVAQEEVDIGVAGPSTTGASASAYARPPPEYQPDEAQYHSQHHQPGSQYRPYQPGGGPSQYPPAGQYPAGPQYHSEFEYQGGAAGRVDPREPVKEQQWV